MERASLVDTHVHLHFPDYDADRGDVIRRARETGVEFFVNVGTDLETSRRSLELAQSHPDIYAVAGYHPHDAKEADPESLASIEELVRNPRVVAIGEVGLDFYRDHSPRETQIEIFGFFLQLHFKTRKPLVIHCRDAYPELARLLAGHAEKYEGIIHCFSSNTEDMERFLELGFYISFAGPLTYKKNDGLREACRNCPAERLLIETDGPFLAPQSKRGKRNEPAYILETAAMAAEVRGVSVEELGRLTTANARKVFRL